MKQLIVAAITMATLPTLLQAQPSAHYVPGVEGIKGASLPPPGVYLRDYNVFYFADQLNDNNGNEIPGADPNAFIYANVPRLLWITDVKVLGGYLGVDALVPLKYTDLEIGGFDDSTFGVGDAFVEGTLSWHTKKTDLAIGYGVWAPTGDFSATNPTQAGQGYWTHMLTAGATWYPDDGKKFSLSLLNRYEINTEQDDTDTTPGQAYTLEGGLGYALKPTLDVGVAGYLQLQTTDDSGPNASPNSDQVIAVGPEISGVWPAAKLLYSVRYLYEVAAENRLQGNTVVLTLTKRF